MSCRIRNDLSANQCKKLISGYLFLLISQTKKYGVELVVQCREAPNFVGLFSTYYGPYHHLEEY